MKSRIQFKTFLKRFKKLKKSPEVVVCGFGVALGTRRIPLRYFANQRAIALTNEFLNNVSSAPFVQVENPDRESQERYYNNIIKSRVERLKTAENNENATKTVMETLQKEIAEYKKNYQKGRK